MLAHITQRLKGTVLYKMGTVQAVTKVTLKMKTGTKITRLFPCEDFLPLQALI